MESGVEFNAMFIYCQGQCFPNRGFYAGARRNYDLLKKYTHMC